MAPSSLFQSLLFLLISTFGTKETTKQLTQKLNYMLTSEPVFWGWGAGITIAGRDTV